MVITIPMSFDDAEAADEFFDFDLAEDQAINNRITTRFIRKDIKVTFSKNGLFSFGRETPADLIDISSKGVLIRSHKKLDIRDEITLELKFDSGKTFKIEGIVVRKPTLSNIRYGIKFKRYNDELGDYLLETQKELIFK
ncbi:PilZ domain-containing protein [Methylobacter sp. Wu1]|uniref:PilZ domain-containing protein n=1 Tax=Methylobacter sp. Wu1 TaxID=3119359 RepID=UPI002F9224DB